MKYIYDEGFFAYSYKRKPYKFTPEDKQWLKRRRERIQAELRRRYPQYFRD